MNLVSNVQFLGDRKRQVEQKQATLMGRNFVLFEMHLLLREREGGIVQSPSIITYSYLGWGIHHRIHSKLCKNNPVYLVHKSRCLQKITRIGFIQFLE